MASISNVRVSHSGPHASGISTVLPASVFSPTSIHQLPPLQAFRLSTSLNMLNAKNKVPEHQRFYQAAYKAHTRLWMIGSRSRWYMTPYLIVLWGGFGATMYAAGRKVLGHNTWFGKE